MVLFVFYAVVTAGVLGSTLFYLPFPELRQHISFGVNIVQMGLLSLLSFMAYRQELHFRVIFFHFWLLFTAVGLAAPAYYHSHYLLGQDRAIAAFVIIIILTHVLFAWISGKTVFTYIFRDEKKWAVNLLAAAIVLPLGLWWFWPYYLSPTDVLTSQIALSGGDIYDPVNRGVIKINAASLLLLVAFFLHKLKTDRPIGAYADTILFFFGVFVLIDTVEYVAQVTSVELLSITQWATSAILLAMTVTLLLRLKYQTQTIAQYYESQLLSADPRIDRRIGWFDRTILWCFFDPKKVGESVFLGTGRAQVRVKRTGSKVRRSTNLD